MPRELIYTAADEGIDGLRGCLCYAGASNDALSNKLLLQNLLAINNYQELYKAGNPREHNNPIGFSHYRFNAGVRDCSVISRIGPAPLYANRTNFIAHHVILDDMDRAKAGPAWAINNFKFRDHWSPQIGRLDTQRLVIGSLEPQICNYWKSIVGDAGWAGWLAERAQSGKPITVLYPTGLDPLTLIQEAIALLPEYQRWNITFSTYYTLGGRGPNCTLRFIPLEADSLAAPFSDKTFHDGVLNLARGLGNAPTGALVNLARGEKPKDKPIPSGLGVPSGSSFIPSFDPIKSDIPGLMPSKDPLFSKSELFIDTKDNVESFDNLKPSGPDNTWKTITFLAGILGLLFLLVLPPLFTWLIANSVNEGKLAANLVIKEKDFNILEGAVKQLEKQEKEENKRLTELNDNITKIAKTNTYLDKKITDANNSNNKETIIEVVDLAQLKLSLKDPKLKEKSGFIMPKKIVLDLLAEKKTQEDRIIKYVPQEKESLIAFIEKNKTKILENGDIITKHLEELKKTADIKFVEVNKNNTKKYFKVTDWIKEDESNLKGKNYLENIKKDLHANLGKIKNAKQTNDDGVVLPLAHMIILNILIKNNDKNLYLLNECRDRLSELIDLLLDEKKEKIFSNPQKVMDFQKDNPNKVSEIFAIINLEPRKIGPFTFSIEDWKEFIKEFDNHLDKSKLNEIKDAEKTNELIKYSQMKITDFWQGKTK